MPFFEFPEDARWNADRAAVEFSVILRPYEGVVRIGPASLPAPPRSVADARAMHGGIPPPADPVRANRGAEAAAPAVDR